MVILVTSGNHGTFLLSDTITVTQNASPLVITTVSVFILFSPQTSCSVIHVAAIPPHRGKYITEKVAVYMQYLQFKQGQRRVSFPQAYVSSQSIETKLPTECRDIMV